MIRADLVHEAAVLPFGLQPAIWEGSFNARECSLHQLAPYVGKLKTGMVNAIIDEFTVPGDTVLDPFCGSGVVPLQCLLQQRRTFANDLSEYAYALTKAKLCAPATEKAALEQAEDVIADVAAFAGAKEIDAPEWVRSFFHPQTFVETYSAFESASIRQFPFITGCLLGILHHVRPGFLSFPASHLTPYLREKKYPREEFPDMYEYRDLAPRLRAKIRRAYKRPPESRWSSADFKVTAENAMEMSFESESVDAIISSPPYFGALDYARDNRLRLWFLGVENWRALDKSLTANESVYLPQMRNCILEMARVLRPGGYCVLVLGDVERNGKMRETAEIISAEAEAVTEGAFHTRRIVVDKIPDERRSRRNTVTTKYEKILVMQKR